MKRLNIPIVLAGLACLPTTYSQTRGGSLLVSIVLICLLVSAGFFIDYRMKVRSNWHYMSFILGALVSEAVFFGYWGLRHGYSDGYGFRFNFQISLIEFLAISIIGCATIAIFSQVMKHATKPST
jgi:UDP-N-acetylmuramyl pentapeptide phosphotransferase/UDP-N-acetylglucosamine-1-phosphate transferase